MTQDKSGSNGIWEFLLIILGIIIIGTFVVHYVYKKVVTPVKQTVKQDAISVESRSRDAMRKSAMNIYTSALELYKSQNGNYPIKTTCASPQNLGLEVSNSPVEPFKDPSLTYQDSSWLDYCYQSDATGTKFTLWAKLENSDENKTSQINTKPNFPVPPGFEPNYNFMQSEK